VATAAVPFSSARKWSGASFDERGTWVLGAPEVLLAPLGRETDLRRHVEQAIATGQRILLLARSRAPLAGDDLPSRLQAQALVVLAEDVREQAGETVSFFHDQGVRTLLISGDHPQTVASVGRRVGVPRVDQPVAAADLPDDPEALADLLERRNVFGRVTPDDKRAMVRALQDRRHVVAMTGDGVNDVLALKDADIGIAMGNGAPATRSVAQLVLLDSNFATIPHIVAEGRRVIANIQRVANLFVTKTVYATLLAIAIGIAQLDFPFLPRHLSLIGGLTIGVPAFFLALEPARRRAQPGFVKRTLAFAIPTGTAAAVATFAAYWLAQTFPTVTLEQARTTATVTLFGLGVIVLRLLCRPMNQLRRTLVYGSVIAFLFTLLLPGTRRFFALELPPVIVLLAAVGIVAIAAVVMETTANALEVGQRLVRDRPTVVARMREQGQAAQHRLVRLTATLAHPRKRPPD
jgi:cation-transporting ATPase E/undecaprenyl-diphosphatase